MSINNKNEWQDLLVKAQQGDSDAQFEVGSYYENGLKNTNGVIIVESNQNKAIQWYELSAQKGDVSSQIALGNILSSGEKRDIETAINWTKKAIEQGSASAAHNLATIYRDLGKLSVAFNWYNKAIEMGDLDSLLQVGLCYLFGIGTDQNFTKAYKSLKKITVTEMENICQRTGEDARYWLAILHLLNIGGIDKSVSQARKYLEIANKDFDHEQANELLNIIGKSELKIFSKDINCSLENLNGLT